MACQKSKLYNLLGQGSKPKDQRWYSWCNSTQRLSKIQIREPDPDGSVGGVPLGFIHDEPERQGKQAALEICHLVAQNLIASCRPMFPIVMPPAKNIHGNQERT